MHLRISRSKKLTPVVVVEIAKEGRLSYAQFTVDGDLKEEDFLGPFDYQDTNSNICCWPVVI
jgi:hypothetical protein